MSAEILAQQEYSVTLMHESQLSNQVKPSSKWHHKVNFTRFH